MTCNTFSTPCDIFKPCQNNGTCLSSRSVTNDYISQCPSGFNGTECQIDIRPCKPDICWNNGISFSSI